MKILLDENFPLALYRRLTADGEHVEHIITLGWRGASDRRIRDRLVEKHLLFLTQRRKTSCSTNRPKRS